MKSLTSSNNKKCPGRNLLIKIFINLPAMLKLWELFVSSSQQNRMGKNEKRILLIWIGMTNHFVSYYEVKSKNEDHSISFKAWAFKLKIQSIFMKFNPLETTFIKNARLYEKLDFYAIIQLKMSSLCTRSVTVGRLWSPTK